MQDFDVVVIGAGFAGLAAYGALVGAGYSVAVLEATGRAGGRARTSLRFSSPVDEGCCWLHRADVNPLRSLAEGCGMDFFAHDGFPFWLYRNGTRIPATMQREAEQALERLETDIAGHRGTDVALETLARGDGWMDRWAGGVIGPLDGGAETSELSVAALRSESLTEPDIFTRQGLGHLASVLAAAVPVHLDTPVLSVDTSGPRVLLTTGRGTLSARACVVTVSTGVLANGSIKFSPPLPDAKMDAVQALPMGDYNKAFLQLDRGFGHIRPGEWASEADLAADSQVHFLLHPYDDTVLLVQAGGKTGRQLSGMTREDGVAWAREAVRSCFGNGSDAMVTDGDKTGWRHEPAFAGSYSHVRVGRIDARDTIGLPVDGKLFFGGEATAGALAQTAGGAWLSGLRCAEEIRAALPV